MDEYSCVRCLFCHTGQEETVVKAIQENGWGRAIFPQRVKTLQRGRERIETLAPLVPGYVFVYSEQATVRRDELRSLRHVIRVLAYGEAGKDELVGRDREFADWLWKLDGKIGVMKALQIGDSIKIIDGVFQQLRGTITQMDRRRQTIRVELDTQGAIRYIWLAYDIVDKLDAKA